MTASMVAFVTFFTGLVAPANADVDVSSFGQVAYYQGKPFDISKSWGEATSCVVLAGEHTECFESNAAADEYIAKAGLTTSGSDGGAVEQLGVAANWDCASGWLCLFAEPDGAGRRLIFNDEYWHYLDDWGFNKQTSSWRNNQDCSDWGGLGNGDAAHDLNLGGCTRSGHMGSKNNWAIYVHG